MPSYLRLLYYGTTTVLFTVVLFVDWFLVWKLYNTVQPLLVSHYNNTRNRTGTVMSELSSETEISRRASISPAQSSSSESAVRQLRLTITATVFLVMQTTVELVRSVSNLVYSTKDGGISDFNDSSYNAGLLLVGFVVSVLTYMSIILVYLARLRSTFSSVRSAKPPEWFFRFIYSTLVVSPMFALLSGIVNAFVNSKSASSIAAMLLAASLGIYLISSLAATGMFVYCTLKVGRLYSGYDREASGAGETEASLGLIHVAVRLSICVGFSLVSTFLSMVMLVLTISTGKPYSAIQPTHVVFYGLFLLDPPINLFSFLCCFKQNNQYYQFVFGRLHNFIMNFISPSVVSN